MNETYSVAFDSGTKLPLVPFLQALHGGTPFGLEILYPRVPWAKTVSGRVEHVCIPASGHRKHQAKMLRKMRQWGRP